jgi:hypothetical protein
MRRVTLVFILLVISSLAKAEWIKLFTAANGTTYYYEDSSIRKKSNKIRIWQMGDHNKIQVVNGKKFLSNKTLNEYDCENEEDRLLHAIMFEKHLGQGEVIHSESYLNKDFVKSIAPTSVERSYFNIACNIK